MENFNGESGANERSLGRGAKREIGDGPRWNGNGGKRKSAERTHVGATILILTPLAGRRFLKLLNNPLTPNLLDP